MERDWVSELERWLQDRFVALCDTIGYSAPLSRLRIHPDLATEESKYFLLGMEEGLFVADELGYVQSALLPLPGANDSRHETCRIFWHEPPPPRLSRECICQLSTASFLIIKRGWLPSHILLDPDCKDSCDTPCGIDILVQSPPGVTLVAVEVKRSLAELQKLVRDLGTCCQRGAHGKDDCGFPQNHPKYEFCAHYKPAYFWAVAPDADVCLAMKYGEGSIELEPLESLPPRSLLEAT